MLKELFTIPPENEGVGVYIDEIYNSLVYWINHDEHPLQDYELMCTLKDFVDTYFEREQEGKA